MSKLEVDKIDPQSGTALEIGSSGDTITIPSGATLDASNATTTLPANVVTTDGTQTLTNKSIAATQLTGTITPSDNTVSLAKLTATGTKDATTFLRGDNTFAEAGGGKVLQVVQGSTSTETRSSSNTLIDTTLSASITPSSSSNKVLVTVFQNGCDKSAANSGNQMVLKLLRGASVITTFGNNVTYTNSAISNSIGTVGTMYLDSPATTSATTYKTQFSNGNNTANVGVQGTGGETSIITLMEISA